MSAPAILLSPPYYRAPDQYQANPPLLLELPMTYLPPDTQELYVDMLLLICDSSLPRLVPCVLDGGQKGQKTCGSNCHRSTGLCFQTPMFPPATCAMCLSTASRRILTHAVGAYLRSRTTKCYGNSSFCNSNKAVGSPQRFSPARLPSSSPSRSGDITLGFIPVNAMCLG